MWPAPNLMALVTRIPNCGIKMDNHNMLQSQTLQFMYTVPAVWHYSKLLFAVPTNSKAYCVCYQQVGYQHI